MRKCLFRINGSEANYYSEYNEDTPLNSNEVIVNFMHDKFLEVIHIDDGDIKWVSKSYADRSPDIVKLKGVDGYTNYKYKKNCKSVRWD